MPADPSDALQLLMVHADDREPVLDDEGLPGDSPPEAEGTRRSVPLWDEGENPNDLPAQRWSVIVPDGDEGERLLGAVDDLIEARRRQMDIPRIEPYRVPPKMCLDEAVQWRKKVFDPGTDLRVELPRYLMILGDLDQVPLELQQVLAADAFVGRVAFDDEADYEAYAAKVLRWERKPATDDRGRSLFFTVHDGTPATHLGHQALVTPGLSKARERREKGHYRAEEVVEIGDRWACGPDDLMEQVGPGTPSVLFSLSHGLGAPRAGWGSEEERRLRQGAMSFGRDGSVAGADMTSRPFLPGGIWFMLACFGAGTPSGSAYHHWLAKLQADGQFPGRLDFLLSGLPADGERPFVAALPKAVLANPEGPLAFMGHVDLAFSYSFQELDSGPVSRPGRFLRILQSALKRDRAGIAFHEMARGLSLVNQELTMLVDGDMASGGEVEAVLEEQVRRSHLWMLRQDLAAYMLLGDPAVRLPVGAEQAAKAPADVNLSAMLGLPGGATPVSSAPAPDPPADAPPAMDIDVLEEAIGEVLVGEKGVKLVAREAGIDIAVLKRAVDLYRAAGREALRSGGLV